jgi:hypothetical protein
MCTLVIKMSEKHSLAAILAEEHGIDVEPILRAAPWHDFWFL